MRNQEWSSYCINRTVMIFHWATMYAAAQGLYTRLMFAVSCSELTHCGLATPYGDKELSQHWPRKWLVAWRHQAITWTNVDLQSVRSCGIHRRALSCEDLKIPISKTRLKITLLESHSDIPGANELIVYLTHILRGDMSLAPRQSCDCPRPSEATLKNVGRYTICIPYERWYNHNKTKHGRIMCILDEIVVVNFISNRGE